LNEKPYLFFAEKSLALSAATCGFYKGEYLNFDRFLLSFLAKRFHVTVQTIINGIRAIDNGEETVQMPERANRYPACIGFL